MPNIVCTHTDFPICHICDKKKEKVYIVIPSCEKEEIRAYSEEVEALKYLNSILMRYAEISGYIQELEVNKICL